MDFLTSTDIHRSLTYGTDWELSGPICSEGYLLAPDTDWEGDGVFTIVFFVTEIQGGPLRVITFWRFGGEKSRPGSLENWLCQRKTGGVRRPPGPLEYGVGLTEITEDGT